VILVSGADQVEHSRLTNPTIRSSAINRGFRLVLVPLIFSASGPVIRPTVSAALQSLPDGSAVPDLNPDLRSAATQIFV
jgi:hypothetical protein